MTVSVNNIRTAAKTLDGHVISTPLFYAPALSRRLGCEIFVKLECLQHTSSFKARGAYMAMHGLAH